MMDGFVTLAQTISERALNTAVEGFVLAAAVWLLLRIFGRHHSRTRFLVWFIALLAIAALPFLAGAPSGVLSHRASGSAGVTLPASFAVFLFLGWITGVSIGAAKLALGLWRVRQLRKSCVEMHPAVIEPVANHLRDNGRRVKLCASNEVTVPTAIGFFHPAVVFPKPLLSQLSAQEMEVMFLHELAHLRRRDDWTNLAQKLLKAVFFFHPAVWWIDDRLALEREMACDEMVIAETGSAKGYASLLLSFTEKLQERRGFGLVHGLVSRVCQLSSRIHEILAWNGAKGAGFRKPLLGISVAVFAAVFGITTHAPQWIHFAATADPIQAQIAHRNTHLHTMPASDPERPQVIPATFHPDREAPAMIASPSAEAHTTMVIRKKPAKTPRKVKAVQLRPFAAQQVFVVLQQAEYDVSGSGVWSICVWQLGPDSQGRAQLESAIVMKI
jgi:beta-lactamase regulating signal transducer with metallopeptidase domain